MQRFFPVLDEALTIGLETVVPLRETVNYPLPKGFSLNYSKAGPHIPLRHPATVTGEKLMPLLFCTEIELREKVLPQQFAWLSFPRVPGGLTRIFQRLNFKLAPNPEILGAVCGRQNENQPFAIRHRDQSPTDPLGYLNLDFLSRAPRWNPLFIKYHLFSPLTELEYGYLEVNAGEGEGGGYWVMVQRVSSEKVPEFLKTAATLPA